MLGFFFVVIGLVLVIVDMIAPRVSWLLHVGVIFIAVGILFGVEPLHISTGTR